MEHLLIGQIGQIALITFLVFALLALISYIISIRKDSTWVKFADLSFTISAIGVFVAFACVFLILKNHYYEYKYAYEHSNNVMSPKFLLAAIWEGQEGSFLLWSIWNSVIGLVLIMHKTKLKPAVMMVISLAQLCLSTMVIGLQVGDTFIGSTPFILFKDAFSNIPFIINNPDNYLDFLKDGNGLNPLLQNYWMVIHPPVLFLGFALTIVPFAFAVSGMIYKEYKLWNNEVMPWTSIGAGILGLGIIMGAAWAYEALSFGGYWAWDPVENASLVPWLTLIAGLHTMIIFRATGHSMRITIFFFLITFILVLYSTFLTRSGILGDTSVHAFTDLGMNGQLLIFMLIFLVPALFLFFKDYKQIPHKKEEEDIWSREFWMFLGSLILLMSALHITVFTSVPVWNKLFGLNLAPPTDVVAFYNKVQIWFAIVILILTAVVLYLNFKKTNPRIFWDKLKWPFALAILLTIIISISQKISGFGYIFMNLATSLAIVGNIYYLWKYNHWNISKGAAAFTHFGFGIMMLGVLISSYNKKVISLNNNGVGLDLGITDPEKNAKENGENLLLIRQVPSQMSEYAITYVKDSTPLPNHFYSILFEKFNNQLEKTETFELLPNVQFNPNMGGIISNPDTRHYWNKDIFTYITKAVDKEASEDSIDISEYVMSVGDTAFFSNGFAVMKNMKPIDNGKDIGLDITLRIFTLKMDSMDLHPLYIIQGNNVINNPVRDESLKLDINIEKILTETNQIKIQFAQSTLASDFVVIKSILFPYINLVWLGAIIMTIGFILSAMKRRKKAIDSR